MHPPEGARLPVVVPETLPKTTLVIIYAFDVQLGYSPKGISFFLGKKGCQSDLTSHKSLPKELSRCWMSCLTSERKACSDMRIYLPASSDSSRFSCDETPSQNVTPKSVTPRQFQYLYWNFPPWSIQNVPPHQRKCRKCLDLCNPSRP